MEIANGFKQKITDFQTANEGMSNKFRNYEFMQGISFERVKLARIFSSDTMLRRQQIRASSSLEASLDVQNSQQSLNTKMGSGKKLVT